MRYVRKSWPSDVRLRRRISTPATTQVAHRLVELKLGGAGDHLAARSFSGWCRSLTTVRLSEFRNPFRQGSTGCGQSQPRPARRGEKIRRAAEGKAVATRVHERSSDRTKQTSEKSKASFPDGEYSPRTRQLEARLVLRYEVEPSTGECANENPQGHPVHIIWAYRCVSRPSSDQPGPGQERHYPAHAVPVHGQRSQMRDR